MVQLFSDNQLNIYLSGPLKITVQYYKSTNYSISDCTLHDMLVQLTSFKAAICTANSSSILGNASAFLRDWLRFCSASSSFSC